MPTLSCVGRICVAAGVLLAPFSPAAPAAHGPATTVDFAPRVVAQLHRYGEDEGAVLREAILAAVSRETGRVTTPPGLAITVLVQDVGPTHPTRALLSDDPASDVTKTKFIGGAELTGYVRDGGGRLLATVRYRHFAPTLEMGSASLEPWADARLAIDQFAARLAAACRNLPGQRKDNN